MKNKFLITGGNQGLGKHLCHHYNATSVSRSTGHDICRDKNIIAAMSLDFDVFVNNAFDAAFEQPWADFGQVKLLAAVAETWKQNNKSGWIINIGGVASLDLVPPELLWEGYRVNKAALRFHSQQWARAFKQNEVLFRTSVLSIDRLDTPTGRARSSWNGNGHNLDDIVNIIDLCLDVQGNTCIEEITAWVNLAYSDNRHV